ncbi:MlaE family lipid ABC transporter permease subunit [Kaistia dalseonensis]|uniref:Phospholipid/cholesterol/gamma-HCH transport system permease protein n=1 Tax=Kaistia dalseonensis TaxID=410840 RepID=A0ABU0H1D1_9HYPH|nr:MlaE family lipid ABC transporter permease subunit [Kaistia dalseonensis]MCX5493550.1 MlaE family lipid ABC transporter permease subunit [Kaistia dalseonensis]MDQ0436110.1 phospholipid/cholesterol/gamma-HCH transport system permease protein [Kaistia dalseonensis]
MATKTASQLELLDVNGHARIVASGPWTVQTVNGIEPLVDNAVASPAKQITIDLAGITHIDTAGAWMITRLERGLAANGTKIELVGASDNATRLLKALDSAERVIPPPRPHIGVGREMIEGVGRTMYNSANDLEAGLNILGGVTRGFVRALVHPARFRFTSIVFHIDRTGLRAVPIIALMSLLIGAIIAQQSAFQLRSFGAEVYVVDLVGVLVLRELGVLLTAIMIAGRSGSAFTAEIGSMKMREEIDALSVIGLDPTEVLIMPRIFALIIALPLLTFISDIMALIGGGLVSWVYVGLPPSAFIMRLRDAVALNTLFVGLIKAPFMALIIGIIAATEGLRVQGSAESLGARTTSSVVKAIFMVIVVDGLFAMYFSAVSY